MKFRCVDYAIINLFIRVFRVDLIITMIHQLLWFTYYVVVVQMRVRSRIVTKMSHFARIYRPINGQWMMTCDCTDSHISTHTALTAYFKWKEYHRLKNQYSMSSKMRRHTNGVITSHGIWWLHALFTLHFQLHALRKERTKCSTFK